MNISGLPTSQNEAIRYFGSSENCHDFLSAMRWPEGVHCAHCNSQNIGGLVVCSVPSRSKKPRPPTTRRLWNCKACKKQFTVKTGTIFEDSALGLDKWLPAVWMLCNAKNGVSSCELARSLGVTQKTAWFMGHRIRLAMREGSFVVSGEVEADETFIGGKIRNMAVKKKQAKYGHRKPGGFFTKEPVLGILQRSPTKAGSRVILEHVANTKAKSLLPHVRGRVTRGSAVYTDALYSYRQLDDEYAHEYVDHMVSYVRGKVHTNGLENFWSLLKRTLGGTYVRCSPEHLFRYLDEQATRFNERADDDLSRFLSTMQRVSGRRLPYMALTNIGLI